MAQSPYSSEPVQDEVGPDVDATPVRQGMMGTGMIWVLAASFLLVLAALFGAWAWRSGDLQSVDHNNRAQPAEARQFDTTAGGPVPQNETR